MCYETAPATLLLATHCCLCNRVLADAASVERGMGPTCAEKAGVGDASELPSWDDAASAVMVALGADAAQLVPGFFAAATVNDARRGSNALVARIAADTASPAVPGLVVAVHELGFVVLAARLREALVGANAVLVSLEGDALVVRAPFSVAFNDALRLRAPARRWDREARAWRVPCAAKRGLWEAISTAFAGGLLVGPKGPVSIPRAA